MGPHPKKRAPTRDAEDFVEVSVKLVKVVSGVTDKAQLYTVDDVRCWLPLSQIKEEELDDQRIKNQVLVKMPLWLAQKSKIEDYVE